MCKKVTIVYIRLKFIPSFTYQTHSYLTHCIPVRLLRNSYIWYPGWMRHRVLIKYPRKYNFFVFVFNSMEVETAALKLFCVMIPSSVYTCRDLGLFRVVRPQTFQKCIVCSFSTKNETTISPKIVCSEVKNVTTGSQMFSAYYLKYLTIHNILLQMETGHLCSLSIIYKLIFGTQMHCKCVPICNNLLQIGTQLHCKCVPICNNLLQFGTQLHCKCVPICNEKSVISKRKNFD